MSAEHGADGGRIWGWDLLRGLCALSVMAYHLLLWQDLAALHTFGTYGVYLFFVLSGASLAYTYGERITSWRAAGAFLVLRWFRLTPLFAAVSVISVALFSAHSGRLTDLLPLRLGLNLTYAFGFYDPVVWSLPIGGWSLGIEFVYYLMFPLLMFGLRRRGGQWPLFGAAIVVQVCWIAATIGGPDGYDANAIAYHQVPAFGAYFVVGCLIGLDARAHRPADPFIIALAAWLMLGGCLAALNPAQAGDQLLGYSGLVLPLTCVLVVWVSGRARVPARLRPVAVWLGDITYGSYLLHPVLFFGLAWFVLPGDPSTHAQRWWLAAGVALTSCLAAMASERWLESPLRRWGRRWTRDRIGPV